MHVGVKMKKIPIKIVEINTPSGEKIKEVMIDVFDYYNVDGKVDKKLQDFRKQYFEIVNDAEKIFFGKHGKKTKKRRSLSSSVYWKLGNKFRKFNNKTKNEFTIKNYAHALLRDFGLNLDYIYDLQTISELFKKNEILDSVPISYYRLLKKKNTHLKKLGVLEKEKKRLNKMGKENKLPGLEKYKEELIKIIKKNSKKK